MAERAHPDDPAFRGHWRFRWRRGFIPWLSWQRNPFRQEFFWRYRWVGQYCPGRDVLDVPCGMGWGTSRLQGCRKLFGLDRNPPSIEEARQKYGGHAQFILGDMAKLPFAEEAFDLVACLEGIEHVPVAVGRSFLAEAARVLRPGGMLFLSSPFSVTGRPSGNPFHVHEYQPEEIRSLLEERFEILEFFDRPVGIVRISYLRGRRRPGLPRESAR